MPADSPTSGLPTIDPTTMAYDDFTSIVDKSDPTDAVTGTNKQTPLQGLVYGVGPWLAAVMSRSELCEFAIDQIWDEAKTWTDPEADHVRSVLHNATIAGRQRIIDALRSAAKAAEYVRSEIGLDPPEDDQPYDLGEPA